MGRDRVIGATLLVVSIAVIVIYSWLLWCPLWQGLDTIILKLTATVAVIAVFGLLAWIGYTLLTTPPPKPIEEIEKEIEELRRKINKETETGQGSGG